MRPAAMALAAAALGGAVPAAADAAYDVCAQKKATTNADYAACGAAYIARADAALNAARRRLYPTLTGRTAADLLAEQRAWITYKDAACRFYANGDQGREGMVIAFPSCRGDVIAARTAQLNAIARALAPR